MTDKPTLGDLAPTPFANRHIGLTDADLHHMLGLLGHDSAPALLRAAIPTEIVDSDELVLPTAVDETRALAELRTLAARNTPATSMIGMGYYGTITPPVIRRAVLENQSWYTAYTPYQPEISQGRLEALLNFQTMVADLTGLPTANASLLDEATAAAEAMAILRRLSKASDEAVLVVDTDIFPQTLAVIETRAKPLGIPVLVTDVSAGLPAGEIFGVIVQYPTASGNVVDYREVTAIAHERGAKVAAVADLLALTLLTPPGEWGADVVCGTTQRFGVPVGFGGPHAAYIAVTDEARRTLPGRLVGVSVDADGNTALRLALQTREQHIRREKATSNICTAQVLLAVIAGMYAVWHGPVGLRRIAQRTHRHAAVLAAGLSGAGIAVRHARFFDTIEVNVPGKAAGVLAAASAAGINIWQVDQDTVRISCDETTTAEQLRALWAAFGVADADVVGLDLQTADAIPEQLRRASDYLTHPVFTRYHSETELLRYLRLLSDRDYALDRGMIPLGSCTMKLNATSEMEPISWPEFADIHPFAPAEQTRGYLQVITDLENWLASVTGYDAVSLQPNAGSQGELAGLLAIAGYHAANGQAYRNICLIPASAHGTNAASAVMAGMKVVVVGCDEHGNVDTDDLDAKIATHRDNLAALMVTYPSTHGVYEAGISAMCAAVHDAGGQVYVDGANLNALVGYARPGRFGADVSHLNLHKTFCIPHGGGGPGVGPVATRAHLAPYLPNHPMRPDAGPVTGPGPIAAAPWGSASILPISWMYVRMMGAAGLRRATESAVLAANYLAVRLRDAYPVLYTGAGGLVAHECILDIRPLTKVTGVTAEDVAKRLIDYGFHAPTMSFPVAGTLMVEPTESESLAELDRFVDAMLAIRVEADQVAAGVWPRDNNPLKNAPHPAERLVGEWPYPYERQVAVYPASGQVARKYWPPVARVDNAFGDRNLMCACPPVSEFAD